MSIGSTALRSLAAARCWCGGSRLEPFGEGYLECGACGTLVRAEMPVEDVTRVRDEDRDLYGREYWFSHQAALGLDDLVARSAADLGERCLHWLRTILAYKLPPGRSLELGAAHGGLTALLARTGFDAVGLELSPWVADWARRTFEIPMLVGPLEDQELQPGSFDLVVAMDVLEHLPDPLGTLTRAAGLLAEDGLLLIQTPCRPADRTLEELRAAEHRFPEMLLPEHLHLFTEESVRTLLERSGLGEVAFEPPLFAHYDMFLVAGRRRPVQSGEGRVRAHLLARPETRLILALLELHAEATRHAESLGKERLRAVELENALCRSDEDRMRRLRRVEELEAACRKADEQRADGLRRIEELEAAHRRAKEGRERGLRRIEELEAAYRQADADRVARLEQVEKLEAAYRRADADRVARLEQVEKLEAAYRQADADRVARLEQVEELHGLLRDEKHARNAVETSFRQAEAERLARRKLEGELRVRLAHLEERHEYLRSLALDHRHSRIYRALVRLGRWRPYDLRLRQALEELPPATGDTPAWSFESCGEPLRRLSGPIAVDLTALLPGGENGGAKLVATELVRALSRLAPERDFTLLTTQPCHEELATLEGPNVRRLRVTADAAGLSRILAEEPFALLFCPTTAPPWHDPRVPLLSLVHDLQFLTYPEFFDGADRGRRDDALRRVARWSQRIVTVSDYVRGTVLERTGRGEDEVVTVHNGLSDRLRHPDRVDVDRRLARHGLERERFFLYPANFWPHKNHRMLLTAYGQLRSRRPDAVGVKLVLTGAERPDPAPFRQAVRRMGLGDAVHFSGYVSDADLSAFLHGCRALVFPSLYEGFGMPVVEAMACGRPVACSNVTGLPEVAGDAALLFDPRRPAEIAGAMERLLDDTELVEKLRARGRERVRRIGDREKTARAYLDVVEAALEAPGRFGDRLAGVYSDSWTSGRFVVSHAGGHRELELGLRNPRGEELAVEASAGSSPEDPARRRAVLGPRESLLVHCRLPAEPGYLELEVTPSFCPADLGDSSDGRLLGLQLWACRLRGGAAADVDLLAPSRDA